MCGILGSYTQKSILIQRKKFKKALNELKHRGPDDKGMELFNINEGELILGQTRLSIIDLSSGGHQPMFSDDGRYVLVFNGEIYNYRELREELKNFGFEFHSNSDSEVLLAFWIKWGINGLRRLNGMFAFVVFDKITGKITLVRDAFGIKPLFFCTENNDICFSSEIPALKKLINFDLDINIQQALNYLTKGEYDNSSDTFYNQIKHLPSGHFLDIDLNNLSQNIKPLRWWWPSIKESCDLSFDDAANRLRDMFLDSVRLHLRSDVPLGAALSGGLDSSALVCAMRFLEPNLPIHTFSFIAQGSIYSEESWVDVINEYVGAISHKVVVDHKELSEDLDDMILSQGEPFGSTSIYAQYRVFESARKNGVIVTFDGQGADELLAGYDGYPFWYSKSLIERKKYLEAIKFLKSWSNWPGRDKKKAFKILTTALLPLKLHAFLRKFLVGERKIQKWLNKEWMFRNGFDLKFEEFASNDNDAIGRRLVEKLRLELTGNGLLPLLRHGDRNSMRWSVESRVPFLTIEIAEFLLSLPESYLLSAKGETKHIFRAAMRGIVPDIVLNRRDKIGFNTPERDWLISQREDILTAINLSVKLPFLNFKLCYEEGNNVLFGKKAHSQEVWRLFNYLKWFNNIQ